MQKRHIWSALLKELTTDEIIVITGPRQVGKTTTLHWLLNQIPSSNKYYFDLENIKNRSLFETKDYTTLLNEWQNLGLSLEERLYIAIDEIQLLPNLPSIIKYFYDHHHIKFLLTGSSSFYIKNHFSESMAGRKLVFEMFPLSFQEFLDFQGVSYQLPDKLDLDQTFPTLTYHSLATYYQEYVEYGGLPKVVLTPSVERKRLLLEEIYSSYITIDVQTMADFKSSTDLRRVIKLLASRVGSRLNVTELSKITGLSRVTIDTYIEFLEKTYLIRTLPAFSESSDVQTRLLRKPYFIDTGIANIVADLSSGSKFENTVCHQLQRYGELSYYLDRSGEIDFIVKTPHEQELIAFEVKETPTDGDARTLARLSQKLELSHQRLIGKEPTATFDEYLWGGWIA